MSRAKFSLQGDTIGVMPSRAFLRGEERNLVGSSAELTHMADCHFQKPIRPKISPRPSFTAWELDRIENSRTQRGDLTESTGDNPFGICFN